ncbi:MAG: signal peptidase I [Chlamydiales bacterium]|jgi:signal peptidase I
MPFTSRNTLLTLVALALCCACQARFFDMPNGSMEPIIHAGERLQVDRAAYRSRLPERGDLVAFHPARHPERLWVLRVVGLPGERLSVNDGRLTADDVELNCAWEPIDEESSRNQVEQHGMPMHIPEGQYFVLGDNVREANDSRFWGTVPLSCIIGRIVPQAGDAADRFSPPAGIDGRSR